MCLQGHWVLNPENSLVWHQTVFNFINKYSGITEESATSSNKTQKSPQARQIENVTSDLENLSVDPEEHEMDKGDDFWTPELDAKLFVVKAQNMSWEQICEWHFPEKTALSCELRYLKLLLDGSL